MTDSCKRVFVVILTPVLLGSSFLPFLRAQGSVSITGRSKADRIQLDRWVDPANGISDPLTEIVKITKGSNVVGIGTFLPECRVATALHVLSGITDKPDKTRGVQNRIDRLEH